MSANSVNKLYKLHDNLIIIILIMWKQLLYG